MPGRFALANGTVLDAPGADTLVTGGNTGFPALANTGVPFAFTDDGSGLVQAPRNNVRYFYAVTAFDVNSFQSGPSSLESQRLARAVTPTRAASNVASAELVSGIAGDDGEALDTAVAFSIDATTGKFSGTPPPTNGVSRNFRAAGADTAAAARSHGQCRLREGQGRDDPTVRAGQRAGRLLHLLRHLQQQREPESFRRTDRRTGLDSFDGITDLIAPLGALPVKPDPTTAARTVYRRVRARPTRPSGSTSISTSSHRPSRARRRGASSSTTPVAARVKSRQAAPVGSTGITRP